MAFIRVSMALESRREPKVLDWLDVTVGGKINRDNNIFCILYILEELHRLMILT